MENFQFSALEIFQVIGYLLVIFGVVGILLNAAEKLTDLIDKKIQ